MAGHRLFLAAVTVAELALHELVHANDLWIAASAVHIGAPLLTADAVFDGVPGLTLHR